MSTKAEILEWYGLDHDPFGQPQGTADILPTLDLRAAVQLLGYAARHRELVALVGEYGSGKTTTMHSALNELAQADAGLRPIHVLAEKGGLTVGQVVEACLAELGHDRIPRTDTARRRLLRQAWRGAHQRGERPLVLIDEAHRVRGGTLKAIKELHEQSRFATAHALFGLVLSGHRQLEAAYALEARDVLARLDAHNVLHLGRWLPVQGRTYIRHRLSAAGGAGILPPDTLERVTARETAVRLNARMWEALRLGWEAGERTLDAAMLEQVGLAQRPLLAAPVDLDEAVNAAMGGSNPTPQGGTDAPTDGTDAGERAAG